MQRMMVDYSSETAPREFVPPPSLLSQVQLPSGQVKLFNFRAKLSNLWQYADAMPQHRPQPSEAYSPIQAQRAAMNLSR